MQSTALEALLAGYFVYQSSLLVFQFFISRLNRILACFFRYDFFRIFLRQHLICLGAEKTAEEDEQA